MIWVATIALVAIGTATSGDGCVQRDEFVALQQHVTAVERQLASLTSQLTTLLNGEGKQPLADLKGEGKQPLADLPRPTGALPSDELHGRRLGVADPPELGVSSTFKLTPSTGKGAWMVAYEDSLHVAVGAATSHVLEVNAAGMEMEGALTVSGAIVANGITSSGTNLNDAITTVSSSVATMTQAFQFSIAVSGAGMAAVNGRYHRNGDTTRPGYVGPKWTCVDCAISCDIFRTDSSESWGWGVVCDGDDGTHLAGDHHRYYSGFDTMGGCTRSDSPTACTWFARNPGSPNPNNDAQNFASDPAPLLSISFESPSFVGTHAGIEMLARGFAALYTPHQHSLDISGAGMAAANGVYRRDGDAILSGYVGPKWTCVDCAIDCFVIRTVSTANFGWGIVCNGDDGTHNDGWHHRYYSGHDSNGGCTSSDSPTACNWFTRGAAGAPAPNVGCTTCASNPAPNVRVAFPKNSPLELLAL